MLAGGGYMVQVPTIHCLRASDFIGSYLGAIPTNIVNNDQPLFEGHFSPIQYYVKYLRKM